MSNGRQLEFWDPHAGTPRGQRETRAKVVRLDPVLMSSGLRLADELEQLRADAQSFVEGATAASTRSVYRSNWARFARWCEQHSRTPLPASSETVAFYLTHLAKRDLAYATQRHALFAIGRVHVAAAAGRPDRDERVLLLMRGIGRSIGTRAQGASALGVEPLSLMVGALGDSVRDVRDRALLLLGFAGAYRSSDLATLNIENLTRDPTGLNVLLARSKDDQLGEGRLTYIPTNPNTQLCAVAAVERWLAQTLAKEGPLFRVILGSRIVQERIHPRAVSRAVQRAASRAGLVDVHYSSHSLRRGFATAAHASGASLHDIQVHGRWAYMSSLSRYIDATSSRILGQVVNQVLDAAESPRLPQMGDVYAGTF